MRIVAPSRLEGERVVLRAPRPADAEPYARAFADDPGLAHTLDVEAPSPAGARRLFAREDRDRADGVSLRMIISDAASTFHGYVLLHSFAWEDRRAECGIMVVAASRRGGRALEALRMLLAWAFAGLPLRRVELVTLRDNVATQRLAERAGFVRVPERPDGEYRAVAVNGTWA